MFTREPPTRASKRKIIARKRSGREQRRRDSRRVEFVDVTEDEFRRRTEVSTVHLALFLVDVVCKHVCHPACSRPNRIRPIPAKYSATVSLGGVGITLISYGKRRSSKQNLLLNLRACQYSPETSGDLRRFMQCVFPNSDHAPALTPQQMRNSDIADAILCEFGNPIGRVVPRLASMNGAAMPKATVDENCDTLSAKNKIGSPGQRNVSPPASDTAVSKDTSKLNLGIAIASRTNRCHHSRPRCLAINVCH